MSYAAQSSPPHHRNLKQFRWRSRTMVTVLFFFTSIMLHVALDAEYRFCWLVVHAAKVISTAPMIPEPVASTPMNQILPEIPCFQMQSSCNTSNWKQEMTPKKRPAIQTIEIFMISVFANRPQSEPVTIPAAPAANNCGHAQ